MTTAPDTHPPPAPAYEPTAAELLAIEQADDPRSLDERGRWELRAKLRGISVNVPPGTHRDLFDARVRLAGAALQGMLAGPVPEGASQHPNDLALVAVQHADAVLWALLQKPCTDPAKDDEMLAALVPHLETGMTDNDVRRAMRATFGPHCRCSAYLGEHVQTEGCVRHV